MKFVEICNLYLNYISVWWIANELKQKIIYDCVQCIKHVVTLDFYLGFYIKESADCEDMGFYTEEHVDCVNIWGFISKNMLTVWTSGVPYWRTYSLFKHLGFYVEEHVDSMNIWGFISKNMLTVWTSGVPYWRTCSLFKHSGFMLKNMLTLWTFGVFCLRIYWFCEHFTSWHDTNYHHLQVSLRLISSLKPL
jgi:hypothetical protein